MSESFQTRLMRWGFNFFPVYRRTGARITYISADWHEVRISLPLNWTTRNYVGTIFGGSMYGAVDPKAASIQFKNPGRSTLYAKFKIEDQELAAIREELKTKDKLDRVYRVELSDKEGTICALVEKTIHFKKKG
jgi:acyl-coenzyme A thioesterase PaaI-like protein